MIITKVNHLRGEITVPGDKSISHRSIMLGAISKGTTVARNFLQGADCLSSIECFRRLGVSIENDTANDTVTIYGRGLHGLKAPDAVLDTGNSGTTTRLISGILAAQNFESILNGDASIQKRPMKRIIEPLGQMGAHIESMNKNGCAPLHIYGSRLHGMNYTSPVASAQVKSAILLAGLYADSKTQVTEPALSRNHSELMLGAFGAHVVSAGKTVTIEPAKELYACDVYVPGDISSAAYFIAAGLMTPDSEICIKNVGINPTRDGIIRVCRQMGADLTLENIHETAGEPVADIIVKTSTLNGTVIGGDIIPALIDEIPVIAVMACFASGTTIIKDAQELKVKESNRIDVMVSNLKAMGADIEATDDGMIIHGGRTLHGADIESHLDHRIAMSFAVAGSLCEGETNIRGGQCVNISYPSFYEDFRQLAR